MEGSRRNGVGKMMAKEGGKSVAERQGELGEGAEWEGFREAIARIDATPFIQ